MRDDRFEAMRKQMADRQRDLEQRVAQRQQDLERRMGRGGGEPASRSTGAGISDGVGQALSGYGADKVATPAFRQDGASALPAVAASSPFPDVCGDAWTLAPQTIKGLMEVVCTSPAVAKNSQYAALVPRLQLKFIETSLERPKELGGFLDHAQVNAYARIDPLEGFPTICLYSGAVRYATLMAAAYAGWKMAVADPAWGKQTGIVPFQRVIAAMVELFRRNGMRLTSELAATFANTYNLNGALSVETWKGGTLTFAYGTIVGVLAHEFGHLALGHCCGPTLNDEISRNHEREADSFASSVVSASDYKETLGLGTIIWELALAVLEAISGTEATSHPHSIERLFNFIRANPSTAEAIGMDEILTLLKTIGVDLSGSHE
ncbi:MAG: hypothetical protein J6334_11780 [Kiritimatiellae bacterium]|nr:hypothetical protein [Kiritimatiellia bacterium]